YFSSNSNLKMALQKTLLKKRLKYRHPLPPKTSFCDKTIGSRELICWTILIKKCMNNLDLFQPNLRRSSGSHCPVWRGMTPKSPLKSLSTVRDRQQERLTNKMK